MSMLCEQIERFIREMMDEALEIELRRNELASHFNCAPSQINYVLATRFTVDRGYLVQSKRGGGGYVRVVRLRVQPEAYLLHLVRERLHLSVSQPEAMAITSTLRSQGWIAPREERLIDSMLRDEALTVPVGAKDAMRAGMLRAVVMEILESRTNLMLTDAADPY